MKNILCFKNKRHLNRRGWSTSIDWTLLTNQLIFDKTKIKVQVVARIVKLDYFVFKESEEKNPTLLSIFSEISNWIRKNVRQCECIKSRFQKYLRKKTSRATSTTWKKTKNFHSLIYSNFKTHFLIYTFFCKTKKNCFINITLKSGHKFREVFAFFFCFISRSIEFKAHRES
jgi:hypothetical protein